MYIYVCICVYVYFLNMFPIYVYICMYLCVCVFLKYVSALSRNLHTHVRVHVCVCVYICMHVRNILRVQVRAWDRHTDRQTNVIHTFTPHKYDFFLFWVLPASFPSESIFQFIITQLGKTYRNWNVSEREIPLAQSVCPANSNGQTQTSKNSNGRKLKRPTETAKLKRPTWNANIFTKK